MKSFQNLKILQNLYRLKALGYTYIDPIEVNTPQIKPTANDLESLQRQIATCHLCDFSKSRKQSMSGFGTQDAEVLFIDYAVSQIEDEDGSYFSGRSGEMIKNMITKVLELPLEKIFYTHAIKCKPLTLQQEYPSQWQSCKAYLFSQIELIQPKVIVTLGEAALNALLGKNEDLKKVRGHIIPFAGKRVIPLYHPTYLLRNPHLKKVAFNDLKTIKSCL